MFFISCPTFNKLYFLFYSFVQVEDHLVVPYIFDELLIIFTALIYYSMLLNP